jgi:hypothetical protein
MLMATVRKVKYGYHGIVRERVHVKGLLHADYVLSASVPITRLTQIDALDDAVQLIKENFPFRPLVFSDVKEGNKIFCMF